MSKEMLLSLTEEEIKAIEQSLQHTVAVMEKETLWCHRLGWVDAKSYSREMYAGVRDKMELALEGRENKEQIGTEEDTLEAPLEKAPNIHYHKTVDIAYCTSNSYWEYSILAQRMTSSCMGEPDVWVKLPKLYYKSEEKKPRGYVVPCVGS